MSSAKILAVLCASGLLFFTIFWFTSTKPSDFSSLIHPEGLQEALAWLQLKGDNSDTPSLNNLMPLRFSKETIPILKGNNFDTSGSPLDTVEQVASEVASETRWMRAEKESDQKFNGLDVVSETQWMRAEKESNHDFIKGKSAKFLGGFDNEADDYTTSATATEDMKYANSVSASGIHAQTNEEGLGLIAEIKDIDGSATLNDDNHFDQQFGKLEIVAKILPPQRMKAAKESNKDLYGEETVLETVVHNPIMVEEDIVVLSKKNFSDFVAENRYVLVYFYSQQHHRTKYTSLEYKAAAKELKGRVVFAKVDAAEETELAQEHKIRSYPVLNFFIEGVDMHSYRNCCRRDDVVHWVKGKMRGGVRNVIETWRAEDIPTSDSMIVLAVLDSLEGPNAEELASASDLVPEVIIYQTANADIVKMFHIDPEAKRPALFILRKDAKEFIRFDGKFIDKAIADFISMNKFPLVTTFTKHKAHQLFYNPMKQLWLCAPSSNSERAMSIFRKAAESFNGKLLFVHMEMKTDHNEFEMQPCPIDFIRDEPILVAHSANCGDMTYVMPVGRKPTLWNIKLFGNRFLEGTLRCLWYLPNKIIPVSPGQGVIDNDKHSCFCN